MKMRFFAVLILLSLLLTGCWDYTEIELLDFVFGIGIDQVDPDFVVITEMINVSGLGQGSQFDPVVLSTKDRSLSSAGRALLNPSGMVVSWPHAHVFIVSEEVARQGILPALEYSLRSSHMRSTIWVFVAKDCTAEEIFKSKPPFASSVSEHLDSIIRQQALLTSFFPQQIWQFASNITASGISATLPAVELVHVAGELAPVVQGTAVFKRDQMVGWLDKDESQLFALLQGVAERGDFVMDNRVKEGVFPITYEILANQLEIKPVVEGDRASVNIDLELHLNVVELGLAPVNFQDQEVVASLEEQISHAINRRIRDFFRMLHGELNADILGFGRLFRRREPDVWRQHGENWDSYLRDLQVNVEVRCKIVLTGLTSQPSVLRD